MPGGNRGPGQIGADSHAQSATRVADRRAVADRTCWMEWPTHYCLLPLTRKAKGWHAVLSTRCMQKHRRQACADLSDIADGNLKTATKERIMRLPMKSALPGFALALAFSTASFAA